MSADRTDTGNPAVRRQAVTVTCFRLQDGEAVPSARTVATEVPVALAYNGVSHVVMMTTPADLEDFATGFSLTEGIVGAADEILGLDIEDGETGIQISMTIPPQRFAGLDAMRRNLTGRTGCGLCGVDNLTQVVRPLLRVGPGPTIGIAAIHRALEALPAHQSVNRQTGAVHAAAWVEPSGAIALVREDVGRHNALDKLIGAMMRARLAPDAGFAVITSRCSFEMVQKVAAVGMPIVVAISAPTTLALQIAEQTGITLVALARSDSVTVFTNPGRIDTGGSTGAKPRAGRPTSVTTTVGGKVA